MSNSDPQILFPLEILPQLKDMRTQKWHDFVEGFLEKNDGAMGRIAMEVTLSRLVGCTNCEADSFKAMRGCLPCARQALKRFKESDATIMRIFRETEKEIDNYLSTHNLIYKSA
jgi:hypothetical protein